MKKLVAAFIAVLAFQAPSYGQCNPYFDYQEGTSLTLTQFSPKGKEQSSQKVEVLKVSSDGDKQVTDTRMILYDKKGEEVSSNEIKLICENGVFKMDMSRFVPSNMEGVEGISVSFEGDALEMPSELEAGKNLKEATFAIVITSDNPAMAAMMGKTNTTIYNRKVEGREQLSTPAGTFDCFKISYNTRVNTSMMGMSRTLEMKGIEWISEGVGMVRTESYSKDGKLEGYTELTAFSK